MSDPDDPFHILQVPYDASLGDIRQAFRRLARSTHPDLGGSPTAFHRARSAYDALASDLDGQRRRWQPAPPPHTPDRIDPALFPTCPVHLGRDREGRQTIEYDVEARPPRWRPGSALPPAGRCVRVIPSGREMPAFGVWTVPQEAPLFRCVFGPAPPDDREAPP